jgi:hypothetical protein
MKAIIKKILREYVENNLRNDDFMRKIDYAQKKAIIDSEYPTETKEIKKIEKDIKNKVERAYKDVTGEEPESVDNIVVKVDDTMPPEKIGSFKHPKNKKDIGLMKIHPDALNDKNYVKDILKHELIHAAHGLEDTTARNHGGVFQKVADKVGLPKKYRH